MSTDNDLDNVIAFEEYERLKAFVTESNRIEGITRAPTDAEIQAHTELLKRKMLTIKNVEAFVAVCQPNAQLRATTDVPGVRVGNHIAPPSGSQLMTDLDTLLKHVNEGSLGPYDAHCRYETLHPFTDGNGRPGRAVWLWQMQRDGELRGALRLGFLHMFYYQTLSDRQAKGTHEAGP